MTSGNQSADQAGKIVALQNSDLIRVATLVPQTNLPETASYPEGETLKAMREGFQDHMGCSNRRTPFSAWEPPMEVG